MRRIMSVLASIVLVAASCASTEDPDTQASADRRDPAATQAETDRDTDARRIGGVPLPSADELPETDFDASVVPLADIHFDTFDGRSVSLAHATPELIDRLRDHIPPIARPVYVRPDAIDILQENDLVLGYVTEAGQAYAYPVKILNFHEIVNEAFDDVPVLITYCPLCRSGVVYDRQFDGRTLTFGNTSALFDNDMVMFDHQTNSYWWHIAGRAIVGALSGRELEPLPSSMAQWADWQQRHPNTFVLSTETGFSRPYEIDPFVGFEDRINAGHRPFPDADASRYDPRLSDADEVVGVVIDGQARAYPVARLGDAVVNDELSDLPLVVFSRSQGPTGTVFERRVGDTVLTFRLEENAVIVDEQTGSSWTIDGRAVSGPREGTQLKAVPIRSTFWFAFVASFPDADVFEDG